MCVCVCESPRVWSITACRATYLCNLSFCGSKTQCEATHTSHFSNLVWVKSCPPDTIKDADAHTRGLPMRVCLFRIRGHAVQRCGMMICTHWTSVYGFEWCSEPWSSSLSESITCWEKGTRGLLKKCRLLLDPIFFTFIEYCGDNRWLYKMHPAFFFYVSTCHILARSKSEHNGIKDRPLPTTAVCHQVMWAVHVMWCQTQRHKRGAGREGMLRNANISGQSQ